MKITNLMKGLKGKDYTDKEFRYLLGSRYAFLIYTLIDGETYLAEIERKFLHYGSRSTLLKRISELEHIGLITSMTTSADSRIKILRKT